MKKLLFLFLFATGGNYLFAQQAHTLSEEKPVVIDGIEYGYSIRNVSTRDVGKQDFNRYQVTLYATNKDQCSKVILFGQSLAQSDADMKIVAKFDCVNATGARLTSKTGQIDAKPMFITARVNGTTAQRVQAGYYIGGGETVSNDVIFIVPLNEKPEIKVRVANKTQSL